MTVRREIAQSRRVAPIATEAQWVPGAPPRGKEAYRGPVALEIATGGQYVEGLSGEPARIPAIQSAGRLVAVANGRLQQKRS